MKIEFGRGLKCPGAVLAWLLAISLPGVSQTFQPSNWVNDSFCPNPNYKLEGGGSSSPAFANNGEQRGTLYINSPIGATLKLANLGDSISCTGRVEIAGDVNSTGNLQFRMGLYYQGDHPADTNWLGYMVGNYVGDNNGANTGLMVRNNPNPGNFASGMTGNAMRPKCDHVAYVPGWGAGGYDFELAVTLVARDTQKISWKLSTGSAGGYSYSGCYTNSFALTVPPAFDQVGFMGGAALFQSASSTDSITLKNVAVTFTAGGHGH